MDRPITTLFLLMSVDGKISTGSFDELDVNRDSPKIPGVREGLHHLRIDPVDHKLNCQYKRSDIYHSSLALP